MGNKTSTIAPLRLHRYIMGGLLLLIVGTGTWLSLEARNHADRNIRGEMLRQAGNVASGLSMENMRDLSFRAEDADRPAYQRITRQLQAYSQTTGIRRLYTLGLRDGQLFYGPESLLPDDPNAAPSGTLHLKPPQADFEAFRTTEAATFGPYSDEFGEFVSALVPVFDSLSGEVLLVVGLDMEASVWRNKLQQAQWIPISSTLSILTLLLLGYLVHGVYKRSPHMRVERLRNIAISIYFSIMLLLAVIAFICVRDAEQRAQRELFRTEANAKSQYFADATEQIDLVLHLLTGFFEASENIDREEFGAFCRHIFAGYPIESCYWIPAWSATDAPTFTARLQAEGLPDFSIRRFADDHRPVLDSADPIYPAVYVEPASELPATLGYDFYSHPVLRETLMETLRSGSDLACMVSASTPNSTEPAGFFVFVPISHPRQGGLVCFSVNLDALIKGTAPSGEAPSIAAALFELQAGKKPQSLFCSSCNQCDDMLHAELSARSPLFAFGNTYMMLFTAEPTWFTSNPQRAAWWILGIGLTLALLLTYTAAVLINRPLLLAKQVIKRTRELNESKERYDVAISAAEMGVWEYDIMNDQFILNDRMLEIYGIQKDEFDGNRIKWSNYVHPEDHNLFMRELTASERGEKALNTEVRIIRADGAIRHIHAFGQLIPEKGDTPARMIGVNLDITESATQMEALTNLVQVSSRDSGADYLAAMTLALQKMSKATYTFIGSPVSESRGATLTLATGTRIIENFEYDLAGSPCENVIGRETMVYPENVAGLFPEAPFLQEMKIEAYIGTALYGHDQQCIGILVSLYDHPLKNYDLVKSISELYAVNISHEIERIENIRSLKESEAQYRLLFDNMTSGFALHEMIYDESGNPVDYRYLQINPAFEKLTGLNAEMAIGHTAKELMPETEAYWIENYGKVAKTGKAIELENYAKEIGKFFEVRAFSPEQDRFAVIFSDITERKQSQQALEESRQLLCNIIDTMPERVWWKDIDSRYLGCNIHVAHDAGFDHPDQMIGKTDFDMCWAVHAEAFIASDRELIESGMPRLHDPELQVMEDGSARWIEVSSIPLRDTDGKIFGTLGSYTDITARKEAEEKLLRLSTAIEQSPESIVITDPDGDIQYINPAFENTTGYSADEALGQNPRLLKSGELPPSFYEEMWETLSHGEVWEGRIINKRKDGTLYTEEATISPVRDDNGCTVNYVAVKRDISGEITKEEELRQAQKMEAVGELAGGVAHDFNNILQGIIGFSELLRYSLDDASLEYKNVEEIHKAATRAAKLTQQLLTFSRKQAVRLEENDLNNIVYDSEALLAVLLGDSYDVVMDLPDDLPPVYADQGQLTQIIMNLAVNARDAMPEGGRLSFSTECILINESDAAYIAGARPGCYLCLAVTDTGTGMDDQTQSRIFDPFFTTKEVGAGTGLGLSVIYGIVQQSKGWINVYSEIGKGTCFKVYLPVAEPNEENTDDDPAAGQPGRNARILLIEDDPKILNMVKKVLGQADLTIIAAGSAEEGLVLFDQSADGFDLLMSDMELPGMRGDEFAEALHKKDPELPVLLVSGYRDQVNRWKHLADKGYVFLNKPFTLTILLDTVRNILNDKKGAHG